MMWRLVDTLSSAGTEGLVRTSCLKAWNPNHLLLWLGYPLDQTVEKVEPWKGWLEAGWLPLLEGCQDWLRRRWVEEWTELALSPSHRAPEEWVARLEVLCQRAVAWLDWASSPAGRWDLAGPLYQSLCPPTASLILESMDRLKPDLFRGGLSLGQELAARLGAFTRLAENLSGRFQEATNRLYYDEDHASAQSLVHIVTHLPGVPQFAGWIGYLTERVRTAQQP